MSLCICGHHQDYPSRWRHCDPPWPGASITTAPGQYHHSPGLEISSPGLYSVVVVPPAGAATLITDQLITYHYNYHSGGEILIVRVAK